MRLLRSLLLRAFLREHRQSPLRLALLLLSTALGVAAMVGTLAVNAQVFGAFSAVREGLSTNAPLTVVSDGGGVPLDLVATLTALPEVDVALSLQSVTVRTKNPDGALLLIGGDLRHASRFLGKGRTVRRDPTVLLRGRPLIVLDALGLERLGKKLGDDLSVLTPDGVVELAIAGSFDGGELSKLTGGNVALCLPRLAADLSGSTTHCDRIDVHPRKGVSIAAVKDAIEPLLSPGQRVTATLTPGAGAEDAFSSMRLGLVLAALTAVLAGSFLVANVHAVVLEQRRPRLGLMVALGADRTQLLLAILGEGFVLGLVGSLLGVPLGQGIAQQAVSALRDNLPLLGLPGEPEVTLPPFVAVAGCVAAGVVATLVAVFLPAFVATGAAPSEVLRVRPEARPRRGLSLLVAAGFLLLLLVVFVVGLPAVLATHPYASITLVVLVFAASSPALGYVSLRVQRPLARRRVLWMLTLETLSRHPRRVGLTVAAVGLATALGMQSGAVIESFRATLLPWIDHSVEGDLFVLSGSGRLGQGRNQPLSPAFVEEVRSVEGVRVARGVRGTFLSVRGAHRYVVGLDTARYKDADFFVWHAGDPSVAWASLKNGETALVSDNLAALLTLSVGDTLDLKGNDGPYSLRVAGVVTDYSWNRGTVVVDRSVLARHHDVTTVDLVSIVLKDDASIEDVAARLADRYGESHGVVVLRADGFRTMVTNEIESFFAFATAQKLVVLFIGFLAVLNTVTLSLLARRRELLLLEASGATPWQLTLVGVYEAFLLTTIGVVFGALLGLVIAKILLRDLLLLAAGWTMPLHVPLATLGAFLLGAALTGVLAGIVAMRMVRRGAILSLSDRA